MRWGPACYSRVLKGPPMSFFHLFSVHLLLKLKRARHLLNAGELLGSHIVLLSDVSSTWFAIKIHINIIIVPAVEARPVIKMLVRHSVLICPRATYEVKMVVDPLEYPTQAVGCCEHAADAGHPLASVHHRSWRVTEWKVVTCISKNKFKQSFFYIMLIYLLTVS